MRLGGGRAEELGRRLAAENLRKFDELRAYRFA
jgi:hypothetical protein